MDAVVEFSVNGKPERVVTDGERPLLEVLREQLGLRGTKYGCGEGECGACTVLLDGKAMRSCITAVGEVAGRRVVTIEGLATKDALHPVQQAYIDKGAAQCGYCVPGQIMTAVALLEATPKPSREEIVSALRGNLCRCCNYPKLLSAVERAIELTAKGGVR